MFILRVSFRNDLYLVNGISKQLDVSRICQVLEDGILSNLLTLDFQCMIDIDKVLLCVDSRITDRNIINLFHTLETGCCPHLNTIRLSNNAMGVAGASAMASCLSLGVLNEIKVIDLNRTSVSTL